MPDLIIAYMMCITEVDSTAHYAGVCDHIWLLTVLFSTNKPFVTTQHVACEVVWVVSVLQEGRKHVVTVALHC